MIWMNLLLGPQRDSALGSSFLQLSWLECGSLPVPSLLGLLLALLWLPVLHLFALVFGSPTKVEARWYALFVFFLLTSISLTLILFPHFLDTLNCKVLLEKKKHPTLSVFWEIGIISVCQFVNFLGDGKSLYYSHNFSSYV